MREPNDAEVWRWIPAYEGWYEASDQGHIRSVPRVRLRKNGAPMTLPGCPLKPIADRKGYGYVQLSLPDGTRRHRPVHQLVLEAFVGPMPPGLGVRHLDGNSGNNHLANLRYGTYQENAEDQRQHGTHAWGSRDHCARGHEYTPENTAIRRRDGMSSRVCRECNKRRLCEFWVRKGATTVGSQP